MGYVIDRCMLKCSVAVDNIKDVYTNVRISGGSSAGRLEIKDSHGIWGTVCHDGFHGTAANVTCRQLGYDSGKVLLNQT